MQNQMQNQKYDLKTSIILLNNIQIVKCLIFHVFLSMHQWYLVKKEVADTFLKINNLFEVGV